MARLSKRVWENKKLTINTKVKVYHSCVLSTLLYGSEAWILSSSQERKLNTFHMRCLRRLLGITWQDRIRNEDILERAGTRSMQCILKQKRLRWLGHICRMEDGRIPKDLLFGELEQDPQDVQVSASKTSERDLKDCGINPADPQAATSNRSSLRTTTKLGSRQVEERKTSQMRKRKEERKQQSRSQTNCNSVFTCTRCGRACHSRIGLYSNSRICRG